MTRPRRPSPDLPSPHILRSVSNFQFTKVFSGHSACHAVFVSAQGDAFVYGRNEKGQCGEQQPKRPDSLPSLTPSHPQDSPFSPSKVNKAASPSTRPSAYIAVTISCQPSTPAPRATSSTQLAVAPTLSWSPAAAKSTPLGQTPTLKSLCLAQATRRSSHASKERHGQRAMRVVSSRSPRASPSASSSLPRAKSTPAAQWRRVS